MKVLSQNIADLTQHLNRKYQKDKIQRPLSIGFACGFHGNTGAPVAIANIANALSECFDVRFEALSNSYFNYHLSPRVKKMDSIGDDCDIYIFDLRIDPKEVQRRKDLGKFIIISIHGFVPPVENFSQERRKKMLALADLVHFVGKVQQDSYQLDEDKYFIIPNCVNKVTKTQITNSVGVVGQLDKASKNADKSVEVALRSNCDQIHLWSMKGRISDDPRVVYHSWEYNREKIYNSFDVLVFLSERDTFGLVVAEALSAGIPCLLADLENFSPFLNCPGVKTVPLDDLQNAHHIVNELLENKDNLRDSIIQYYEEHFTPSKFSKIWQEKVKQLKL